MPRRSGGNGSRCRSNSRETAATAVERLPDVPGGPAGPGGLRPAVFMVDGTSLSTLREVPEARQPGVYVGLWEDNGRGSGHAPVTRAYVGVGATDLAGRATANVRFAYPNTPDRLVAIVGDRRPLTGTEATAIERIAYRMVGVDPGIELIHQLPRGYPVGTQHYPLYWSFVSQAISILQHGGLLADAVPDAALTRIGQPEGGAMSDRYALVGCCGTILRLHTGGTAAYAIKLEDDAVLLLAGAALRAEVQASAGPLIEVRREEMLFAGILAATDDPAVLRTTADLRFATLSQAGHFVTGSKAGAPASWQPAPWAPQLRRRAELETAIDAFRF